MSNCFIHLDWRLAFSLPDSWRVTPVRSTDSTVILCSSPEKIGGIEPHIVIELVTPFDHVIRGIDEYFDDFIPRYMMSERGFKFIERENSQTFKGSPKASLLYLHDEEDIILKTKRTALGLYENCLVVCSFTSDKNEFEFLKSTFHIVEDSLLKKDKFLESEHYYPVYLGDEAWLKFIDQSQVYWDRCRQQQKLIDDTGDEETAKAIWRLKGEAYDAWWNRHHHLLEHKSPAEANVETPFRVRALLMALANNALETS